MGMVHIHIFITFSINAYKCISTQKFNKNAYLYITFLKYMKGVPSRPLKLCTSRFFAWST